MYRAHQAEISELIQRVLDIFERNDAWDLIQGFREFISSRHRELYDTTIKQWESKKGESELSRKRPCPMEPEPASKPLSDSMPRVTGGITSPSPGCPVCKDPINNGYVAKCGHTCCFSCWNSWLQIKLECPLCRHRTRIPQLKKATNL